METKTDLANWALGPVLGVGSITSIDEDSELAAACRLALDNSIDTVLRVGAWPSVTTRAVLVPFGTPIPDWKGSFQAPTDMIRPLGLVSCAQWARPEGTLIYTDDEAPELLYIFRPTAFGGQSDILCRAFACQLAVNIAMPVTGDVSKVQLAAAMLDSALAEARTEAATTTSGPVTSEAGWGDL